ncbi:YpdA family putative bacillithiol disulfide reductase [Ascidiimonas aurantiaca]|uniref:YpdA family putative bacillithiol disulfide reductase n=1 Tax=Ascidiimonas aurantiaca TaxID=1685432 RepID=UPI0030ECFD12
MRVFDVIIIGGGPIGIACALEAQKKGLNTVIIEKGCIVNSLFNYPSNMQFFSTSEKLEIDHIPFISKENKPRRAEALEYYRRIVSDHKIHVRLFEKVISVTKKEQLFEVCTHKDSYKARNVIIATGFYDIPNTLNIPGEELPKVSHYYKDPHYYAHSKLVVIGASNSAVDAALECYRKGAQVTMVVRAEGIGDRVKYWVKPDIENRIAEGSIKVFFKSHVTHIATDKVHIQSPEGNTVLENDFVLALTGYRPDFSFLENTGIHLSNDGKKYPHYNPETMETNIENMYLAGVICGGMDTHKWFIENSRIHAGLIINDIGKKLMLK